MGGIGIWQLLIVLVIVVLLFGTKKLKNIGNDLGGAIKNFKRSVNESESAAHKGADGKEAPAAAPKPVENRAQTVEGEIVEEKGDDAPTAKKAQA